MTGIKIDKYQVAKVFHDHAEEYDSWFEDNLVYETELAALKSLHAEMNGPKMEIGVGSARFAEKLGVTFGIDPALAPLKLASKRRVKCCQAFGENLPVKDRTIGTIYILFTLCFALDPQKILRECARTLKENGCLVIGMIPSGSVWGRTLAAKKKAGHLFYKYVRFYTMETLCKWLSNVKMTIVEYNSTLYQDPECVKKIEAPGGVLDEQAGFVVIVAKKGQ